MSIPGGSLVLGRSKSHSNCREEEHRNEPSDHNCCVSVVIPVFNKAPYLTDCLESVLAQSLRHIEVICVDDASTDGSNEILARYAERDSRVKLIRAPTNSGPGPRRNLGIAAAAAPYVQFTDADDLLPEQALELMYRRATADRVPLVKGSICRFESQPNQLEVLVTSKERSTFIPLDERSLWIPWWHQCFLISRALLLENGIGYPGLRSGEDPVFLASVLVHAGIMSSISEVTYHHRIADIEKKGRANSRNLHDFLQHARLVKDVFAAHRPECWIDGYGPHVQEDIEKLIHRYPLSVLEREHLTAEASGIFAEHQAAPKKILFVYRVCGLGGVETSILNKLQALNRVQVVAEALFLELWGAGGTFVKQRRGVHVCSSRESQLELLRQGWDALVVIDSPQFLGVIAEANIRCLVFFETHASYLPALDYYYSATGDPLVSAAIAPSSFNKEMLMAGGCTEEDIHVIPNAIDTEVFRALRTGEAFHIDVVPTHVPLVINVGRLEPQKNTLEFVDIAVALLDQETSAHFVIVGDAVDTLDYSMRVRAAVPPEWKDRVTFIDRIRYEDMPQLYSRAAQSGGCLVVTSLNESQPMTILEAMACRCPVVSSKVGGIGEIVFDGITGRLYESGKTGAAASAVRQLLGDSTLRESVVQRAASYLKLEHSSNRTAELYVALINKARSGEKRPKGLKAGTAGESVPAPQVSALERHLAARLDALVGEFIALHLDILSSQDAGPSTSERVLKSFFSDPLLASNKTPIKAYSELVPDVRIGFEATSNVLLTVQPKQDFSRSPESCLNTIWISFSGMSRWLTLELSINWEEFREAKRYQFGLYAQPDRPLTGQVTLRLPLKSGGHIDHRFAEFRLSERDRNVHRTGALRLPDMSEADPKERPRILFFFDSTSDLNLRLDYLTTYFA